MSEIQRYFFEPTMRISNATLSPTVAAIKDGSGTFVLYTDHTAALRERDECIAALEAENARLSAPVMRKELEAILGDARVTGDVTFQMAARQFADEIIAARKGAA